MQSCGPMKKIIDIVILMQKHNKKYYALSKTKSFSTFFLEIRFCFDGG